MKDPEMMDSDDSLSVSRIRISGYSGMMLARYDTPEIVDDLRRFFLRRWPADTAVARSKDREVHCCAVGREMVVYLKRYRVSGIRPFMRTVLRLNKAQKAWRIGRRLYLKGIDTPLPIALLKSYASDNVLEYVCISMGLPDAVDLYQAVMHVQGSQPAQQTRKQALVCAVAKYVACLHSRHVYHGDFSADNILVRGIEAHQEIRPYVIDLDAVREGYWISERRRVKNLEELGRNFLNLDLVSMADRVRFLKVYLAHYARNNDSLYTLFRKVRQRTEQRLAHFNQAFGHREEK